jgi:hypothetical protein
LVGQAGHDVEKRAAVPLVITPDGTATAGFYALSQYAVNLGELPRNSADGCHRIQWYRQHSCDDWQSIADSLVVVWREITHGCSLTRSPIEPASGVWRSCGSDDPAVDF